jgi:hypothetical protein
MKSYLKNLAFFLVCICLIIALNKCTKDGQPEIVPKILSVGPNTGTFDRLISIEGLNFGLTSADNIVKFNGIETKVLSLTNPSVGNPTGTILKTLVPKNLNVGTVTITVTTDKGTSVGVLFNYILPIPTNYYIKFKADGVLKQFNQAANPGYLNGGKCGFMYINSTNGQSTSLQVCWEIELERQIILDLKNKTLPLRTNAGVPYAGFAYLPSSNNFTFNSAILNNLNSFMKIIDVEYQSSYQGIDAYNVKGTFEGVINDSDVNTILVTEGEFLIRFNVFPK